MTTRFVCGLAASTLLLSAAAVAQDLSYQSTCQSVGGSAPEPLGDREGHAVLVAETSCRVVSGPLSGALVTATSIWEWNGTEATMLSNAGVYRMPGGELVFRGSEGKLTLTMADGKVTGFTASGKGQAILATGTAAPYAGKTTNWTAKSTGPGTFSVEDKVE